MNKDAPASVVGVLVPAPELVLALTPELELELKLELKLALVLALELELKLALALALELELVLGFALWRNVLALMGSALTMIMPSAILVDRAKAERVSGSC